jgi:acetolactate synthase-1/2/3 large subunit
MAGRQSFQDMDQVGMARPVTKMAVEVTSPGHIAFSLRRAFAEAASGRNGAVHLTIPLDVFQSSAGLTATPPRAPTPSDEQPS